MAKKPSEEQIERATKKRPVLDVLNATINDMHNDGLEARLVKMGLATYVKGGN